MNSQIQAEMENLKELMGHLASLLGDKEGLDAASEPMEVTVGGESPDDILKGLDMAKEILPNMEDSMDIPMEEEEEGEIELSGLDALEGDDLKNAVMARLMRK